NDITEKKLLVDSNNNIEDDKKNGLVDSFTIYLQNDITELNNTLLYNNLEINELQRKNLDELFSYLVYFITDFNAHDNTCLKGIKLKAINLGKFYIKQRNVFIAKDSYSSGAIGRAKSSEYNLLLTSIHDMCKDIPEYLSKVLKDNS
ncbi:20910_t:CDS:2, partial [Racocetra persica]